MMVLLRMMLACVLSAAVAQPQRSYDKARHDEMQAIINSWIKSSEGKTLEIPFVEVEKRLSLEGVKWSGGYANAPNSEMRIYHFRGFYLILYLKRLMADGSPMWTSEDLQKRGQWYVYHFYPALHVDGLNDPEKRMSNYWAALSESFRLRSEELKRKQKSSRRKAVRRRARPSQSAPLMLL